MKRLNNKGFTLVELLAVVTILGVLMLIAIPSISSMIEKSRKEAYLEIVKTHQRNIEKLISSDEYYVYDPDTVYYFDYRLGNEDDEKKSSPFGDWVNCWVAVTFKNDKLNYYWFGVDTAGWKIEKKNKTVDRLTIRDIVHSNDKDMLPGASIGGRDKIIKYHLGGNTDGEKTEASNNVSSEEAKKCFSFKQLSDGTYSITNYDVAKCGKEVDVPSSIDNKIVSIIDENAFRNKGITSVILYYGITELKNGAFQNNKITDLKLASSIKTIGPHAFMTNSLTEIDLPDGLVTISEWAFAYNKLNSVRFPTTLKTIGSYAFYGNNLTDIELNSNPALGGAAFSNNKMSETAGIIYKVKNGATDYTTIIGYGGESKDVVIPALKNGVAPKVIASNAFASCGLNSVQIPDSVTDIQSAAFYANNLKQVKLPTNLKTIGAEAFRNNFLSSIEIPNSVTSIGRAAFVYNCLPTGKDIIYRKVAGGWDYSTIVSSGGGRVSSAYSCNGATVLNVPAQKNGVKLKTINPNAFYCSYYTDYNLPNLADTDKLTVGANAFYHNSFSSSKAWIYKIENGKYDYSTLSSYGGSRSGNLVIPEEKNGVKLKTINASFTWTSFSSITIPSSVQTISGGIFTKTNRNNVSLTKIVNKTGRAFDWYQLTGSSHQKPTPVTFEQGTVSHQSGDIVITNK